MIPSDSIIEKYNKTLPRYTSYPPANFFERFSLESYKEALTISNSTNPQNISIYIHIPFCEQLCWYCGCNTEICNSLSKIGMYVETVHIEMEQVFTLLNSSRIVTQIHFGGGSPNSLSISQLQSFITAIAHKFTISPQAEIAIECNPADIDLSYISNLTSIGFNRISLGIQDFNTDVLHAVHRKIPTISIKDFVQKIHECNAQVNFDFIYGLPLQTIEGFTNTIKQSIELSPERIVTFSYAHVPGVKSHQKVLEKYTFPTAKEKLEMLTSSYKQMKAAGYIPIGLDHFAKKTDSLAHAIQTKSLHRNFQGYCTRETTGQVYAFGASAITQLTNSFIQNTKDVEEYTELITTNGFAPKVGYTLTSSEKITGIIIEYILCNECLDWNTIAQATNNNVEELKKMFSWNSKHIEEFEKDRLISITSNGFNILETGKFFLRNIAAAFDISIQNSTKTFSKTI